MLAAACLCAGCSEAGPETPLTVIAGSYEVFWNAQPDGCGSGDLWPCASHGLGAVTWVEDAAHSFDLVRLGPQLRGETRRQLEERTDNGDYDKPIRPSRSPRSSTKGPFIPTIALAA